MSQDLSDIVHLVNFSIISAKVSSEAVKVLWNLLPEKSRERFEVQLNCLKVNTISETVLLAYFNEMICYFNCTSIYVYHVKKTILLSSFLLKHTATVCNM